MTAGTVLVIALLVALNGLYVAAEFSSVSVRRSRLQRLADEGNALAARALPVLDDPHRLDRYIACCQVGITVSSLGLGAYGQARLASALTPVFAGSGALPAAVGAQSAAAAVVLAVLTALQMVIGELVPKSLALQHPTRVALLTFLPTQLSARALSPLIDVLNGSGWAVLRLLGVRPSGHRRVHSPEEIRWLIAESTEGGLLAAEERVRMDRALGLTHRTARDLMVPRTRIEALDADAGLNEAILRAADLPYTRLPVVRGSLDEVVGFVHAKDLARARLLGTTGPIDRCIQPILVVHELLRADRALSLMRERKGVIAIVVDDFGGTAGLLSVEDILAEVLGYVGDEFKEEDPKPERRPDGSVVLPGELRLYAAPPWVGVRWDGESDTVGGLVAERLGRIARPGDVVEIDGVRVRVQRVERNAVRSVIAYPAGSEPASPRPGEAAP